MHTNSIPQNFKNVLKNRIKILITPILYNTVDFLVDNLFAQNLENKYFSLLSSIQSSTRELIRNVVISTFQEIDNAIINSVIIIMFFIIFKSLYFL